MVNNFFNPTAGGSIAELKKLNEEIEQDIHNPDVSDEEILKKMTRKSWEGYNLHQEKVRERCGIFSSAYESELILYIFS